MILRSSIFSFLLLACVTVTSSQSLVIIKDNVECLYGLKNPKGEWVVKPAYTLIRYTDLGYFIVQNGSLEGLLDSSGKTIIPVIYDNISSINDPWSEVSPNYYSSAQNPYSLGPKWKNKALYKERSKDRFLVKKKDKWGLIDKNGKTLFAPGYSAIRKDEENYILYKQEGVGQIYSEYRNHDGEILLPLRKGFIMPFGKREFTLIGDRENGRYGVGGNCGTINRKGEVLIPRTYDYMFFCCADKLFIQKDGKQGMCDQSGNIIIPTEYIIQNDAYSNDPPCICFASQLRVAVKEGKAGVLGMNNKEVVPFIYDRIEKNNYHHSTENFWLLYKDGKYGIASITGKVAVPVEYDTLRAMPAMIDQQWSIDKLKHLHYVAGKKGKYGIITWNGEVIEPFINDTFFRYAWENDVKVAMIQGDKVRAFDLGILPGKETAIKKIAELDDSLMVFSMPGTGVSVFCKHKGKKGKVMKMMESFYDIRIYNSLFYFPFKGYHIFYTDGRRWGSGTFNAIEDNGIRYLVITTHSGKKGALNTTTGKLVIDTIYESITVSDRSRYFWVKNFSSPDCNLQKSDGYQKLCGWALMDTLGKLLTGYSFGAPFMLDYKKKVPVLSNYGMGLFDTGKMKFLSKPVYIDMMDCFPFFYVETKSGKYGMMDTTGQLVADTTWERIDLLFSGSSHRKLNKKPYQESRLQFWIMEGNSTLAIIDGKGKIYKDKHIVDSIRLMSICPVIHEDSISNSASPTFQSELLITDRKFLSTVLDHCQGWFFDMHNKYRSCVSPKPSSYKRYYTSTKYSACINDSDQVSYKLYLAGRNGYSIEVTSWRSSGGMMPSSPYPERRYINYARKNGVFLAISLDSLIAGDIESILQAEMIESLKKRDDVDIDCFNVQKLFRLCGGLFSLSEEGLILYFKISRNAYRYFDLVIPWERLRPHARKNGIVDSFIK